MVEKWHKGLVQMNLRREVEAVLDRMLNEPLYRHCFVTGDEAWTFRYHYDSVAEFPDETIYTGHVSAKAKKKYAAFINEREHRFSCCVRIRGRYDADVALNRIDERDL